jgi:twinkle protein
MAHLLSDSMDFSAYERSTECKAKVRSASQWEDELFAEFAPVEEAASVPTMASTKLREYIDFRPGEVTCWAGYSGHRKSMFLGQAVLDFCAGGYRTLLASFEMLPRMTLARMARQVFACERPTRQALAEFSEWTDERLWLFDHFGRATPSSVIAVTRYFADSLRGHHVVIDSMMMVVGSEEGMDEQKQFMTDLVRVAQETGLHLHLVAHCRKPASGDENKPPTKYDVRGSSAITDQAHNVITVWANKEKARKLAEDPLDTAARALPDARVAIEKQRNGRFEGSMKLWFHEPSMRFFDERHQIVKPYKLEPL